MYALLARCVIVLANLAGEGRVVRVLLMDACRWWGGALF